MRLFRISVCAAVIPLLCLAAPASAGPYRPNVLVFWSSDQNERIQNSNTVSYAVGQEIEKVTFTTTGVFTKAKPRTLYTPKNLVVNIEISSPIKSNGTTRFVVNATLLGCPGRFMLQAQPGTLRPPASVARCTDAGSTAEQPAATYAVAGSTITFTIPLSSKFGLATGSIMSGISAYTTLSEPASVINSETDYAISKDSFTIG